MTPDEDDPALPEDWQVEALLSYDRALAEGRAPEGALTSLEPASSLDAVHRCQRLLEALWPRPAPATPKVPRRFGRFEILRELGRGGFGVVFLAMDPTLGRKVALKLPRPEALIVPEIRRRFLREAEASSRLDHPHIVPVYEVGQEGAVSYIASAYCEGITLAQWLRQRTEPVPFRQAAQLVAVLAEAVGHAHARSILHRDLKPGNILLQPAEPIVPAAGGEDSLGFSPRICDFGLAKLLDQESHETCSGSPIGSPCYMAPEQAAGRTGEFAAHTDVYALGVILFEVLTGRPPHRGETQLATLRLVAEEEPPPIRSLRSAVPRDLETICLKCLAKRPGQRYAGALELAADLRRLLAGRPIQARPLFAWERAWKWARRRPSQAALVIGTAFGLTCLIAVLFWFDDWLRRQNRDFLSAVARAEGEAQRIERAAQEVRLRAAREQFGRQYGQAIQVRLIHETLESGNFGLAAQMHEGLQAAPGQPEPPGFARAYLRRLFRPNVTRLAENDPIRGALLSMALAPDGRTLASGISDGSVILWDLSRKVRIRNLRHKKEGAGAEVYHVAFSPDGQLLASGSADGSLKLWDMTTGRERDNIGRSPGGAFELIFSDDSRDLMVLWCDPSTESARVLVWHIGEAEAHATLAAEHGPAERDSKDGEGRITPGSFARAHLRPSPGVALVRSRLALLPDVSVLAVRPRPGELVLYGLPRFAPAGRIRDSLPIPTVERNGLRDLSPAEFQRYARLFRRIQRSTASAGDLPFRGPYDHSVHSPADGRTMAVFGLGGSPTLLVDQHSGRIEAYYVDQMWRALSLVFAPDGRTVIFGGFHPHIHLWRLDDPPIRGHAKEVWSLAYAPDGRTLASASDDHTINLWDIPSGRARRTLEGHDSLVTAVAYSPDGRTLASSSFDGTIRLWNAATGEPIRRLEGHSSEVRCLAFSPDGRTLASAGNDRTVRLWDLTGRRAHPAPLAGHTDRVFSVLFTHDGKTLVSGSLDRTIRHWDWNQGRVERVWRAEDQILAMALAPAGAPEVLATGDPQGNVLLRDLATGRTLASLRGHALDVLGLAFSPDGLTLASAGRDKTIRLWDPLTGQALLTLKGHDDRVHAVTFSPDGQTLATASHDGVIRFWRAGERPRDPP